MARNHPFIEEQSKERFRQAVESVENRSAAEVVVAVRPMSGDYRHVDLLVGAILSYAGLAFMLFIPSIEFSLLFIMAYSMLLFGIGVLVSASLPPVRRALVSNKLLDKNTLDAGRADFYELGVGRTRDRSGILVYVSLLEKRCRLIPDIGITDALGKERWERLVQEADETLQKEGLRQRGAAALAKAVEDLGPILEKALPRRSDDINELPDFAEE